MECQGTCRKCRYFMLTASTARGEVPTCVRLGSSATPLRLGPPIVSVLCTWGENRQLARRVLVLYVRAIQLVEGGITVLRRATFILSWLSEVSNVSDHSVVSCPVGNGSLHLQAHVGTSSKHLHARIRNELANTNSVTVRARRNLRLSFLNNGQAHKGSVP